MNGWVRRNPALVAKLEQERQLRAGISGHKTGLPKKLLELFAPLPPLPFKDTIRKRKPKTGYSGIAQYVDLFAKPGEDEYEPKAESSLPEPRLFRNPEMPLQARVEGPLKLERCALHCPALARLAPYPLGPLHLHVCGRTCSDQRRRLDHFLACFLSCTSIM